MEAIKEYQSYKERAFDMKNQRNKYKKLYQDACEKVQEVVTKRDEKLKELQCTIHQLQSDISPTNGTPQPNIAIEMNENNPGILRVAPGSNMNRRSNSTIDPKPFMFGIPNKPKTEIPAKRPILIPSMPKRGIDARKLSKPKAPPTSKNVMAWLERK
jgi:DNA-binding protein H-NS